MSSANQSRRIVILGALALSACQTTAGGIGANTPTKEFDGKYEISISRLGRNTALQRSSKEVGIQNELARLTVQSVNGKLSLISLQDFSGTSPNYQNLDASFDTGGIVTFDAVGNILFDRRETRRLTFSAAAGNRLIAGESVSILVEDWDEHWAAAIKMRKI